VRGTLAHAIARLQASLNITNPTIRSLLSRVGEELLNPGFAGAARIEMMAGQIGIELARYLLGIEELPHTGGLSPRNLRPAALSAAFRRATGERPRDYLQHVGRHGRRRPLVGA
jgi:hypothetical protein